MRRIAIVTAVLAALAGGAVAPQTAHAGCAFVVVWHDQVYFDIGRPEALPQPGAPVQGAVEPGCNDTVGANEHPTAIAVRRIVHVSPATALLSGDTVLVATGYLTGVTNVLTGATLPTDETRGCRLGGPVRITGPAQVAFDFMNVHVAESTVHLHHLLRGSAQVHLDGHTRIDGLARNGQPYIGEGQRVRVDARFCKVPGSTGTKIVARRVVPAGPIVRQPTAEDILGADWRGRPTAISNRWLAYAAVAVVLIAAGIVLVWRWANRPPAAP